VSKGWYPLVADKDSFNVLMNRHFPCAFTAESPGRREGGIAWIGFPIKRKIRFVTGLNSSSTHLDPYVMPAI